MGETANRIEDAEKKISADDSALEQGRRRRRETLVICSSFGGVLGTYASGSVAMGVVNDPVEDADGGMIVDRRCYPALGPDVGGDTPRRHRRRAPRLRGPEDPRDLAAGDRA
jgi:hypothetical protein